MLRCVKCGDNGIRIDESHLPNFLEYPGKIRMKCGKCGANYIEEYVMGQKVKKDKGKLKVVKVDPKKPDGCIDCGNAEVDIEDRISFGVDDVVVQVTCSKCNSKYEEAYYRNRITDLNGKTMEGLVQKTLEEKPKKSKKSTTAKAKAKAKAAPKSVKVKPKPKPVKADVAANLAKIRQQGKAAEQRAKKAAETATKAAKAFYRSQRPKLLRQKQAMTKISRGRK